MKLKEIIDKLIIKFTYSELLKILLIIGILLILLFMSNGCSLGISNQKEIDKFHKWQEKEKRNKLISNYFLLEGVNL